MTETTESKIEPTIEAWLYGGTGIARLDGKKRSVWIPLPLKNGSLDDSPALFFSADGDRHLVAGVVYKVKVTRANGHTTMHGSPQWVRLHEDEAIRAHVQATSKACEARLRQEVLARSEKRAPALEEAIAPLVAMARRMPPPDRVAFTAYVITRITKAW